MRRTATTRAPWRCRWPSRCGSAPRQIAEQIAGADRVAVDRVRRGRRAGVHQPAAAPAWYGHVVERVLDEGVRFGAGAAVHPQRLQVEFVSGNPTGPMTRRQRSQRRLRRLAGAAVRVRRARGRARVLLQRRRPPGGSVRRVAARPGRGEEVPEGGYQGAYVDEVADALGLDPDAPVEEWRARGAAAMIDAHPATLERFRVELRPLVPRALAVRGGGGGAGHRGGAARAGHTYEQDGAVWLRSSDAGRRQGPGAGAVRTARPTYIAGDLGYIVSKLERGYDVAVYVLGADHHGYIGRLKAAPSRWATSPTGSTSSSTSWSSRRGWPGGQHVQAARDRA